MTTCKGRRVPSWNVPFSEDTVLQITIGKIEIMLYFRYIVVFCGLTRKPITYYFYEKKKKMYLGFQTTNLHMQFQNKGIS